MRHCMKKLPKGGPKLNDHFFLSKLNKYCNIILLRFLQEVGYEDIFNTEEVNEIKELYDKAQAELTESVNQANSLHTQ